MPGVGLYGSYGSSATTTNNTNNTNNANNEEQTEEINNSNGAEEASGANNVGGAGAAGSGITLQHNNTQDAARYQNAIDINGGVDNDDITNDGQIETSDARANIVEQYASEFYYTALTGKNARTDASALDLQAAGQRMQADLDGLNGEDAQQAATFALVASSYKNGGGNYDNGQIEDIIQQSGYNGPLADNVGTYDVQTLGAAVAAIRSGDIEISDIYDGTDNDAVDDDGKYDAAISKELEND